MKRRDQTQYQSLLKKIDQYGKKKVSIPQEIEFSEDHILSIKQLQLYNSSSKKS